MRNVKAFSLVELSIVLVILGLLVGGVLTGQSLIKAAELRAIPTEHDKFTSAIFAFRDKYFQLPGDINNAFQFWGATCGTNTVTLSTGCNGDGNGNIDETNGETVKVWEHLSRAQLIEGSFDGTGVDNGVGQVVLTQSNVPKSRYPNGYWDISNDPGNAAANGTWFGANISAIVLSTGSINPGNPSLGNDPYPMTHADAWNVDTKIDDGRANTGKMRGDTGAECYDDANGTDPTDYYTLKNGFANNRFCSLYFVVR